MTARTHDLGAITALGLITLIAPPQSIWVVTAMIFGHLSGQSLMISLVAAMPSEFAKPISGDSHAYRAYYLPSLVLGIREY